MTAEEIHEARAEAMAAPVPVGARERAQKYLKWQSEKLRNRIDRAMEGYPVPVCAAVLVELLTAMQEQLDIKWSTDIAESPSQAEGE